MGGICHMNQGSRSQGPLRRWWSQHLGQLSDAIDRMLNQPGSTLLTVAVIAVALALPASLRVVVNNGRLLAASWEDAQDFTVYLDMDVDLERARALAAQVEARPDVQQTILVARDQALRDFKSYSGFGDVLDALEDNPLPHALVVRPAAELISGEAIAALADELAKLPESELVQLDTAWVERFRAMVAIARRAVDLATALLALAVVIIVGNTIRLEINNRRREIEVTKLVGGSDGFIRRPFLYLGLCYGLGGSLMAWLVIALSLQVLKGPAARLAGLYGSSFSLSGLPALESIALVLAGGVLGWLGAGFAAARHIRAIEPE